ncbi:MULTISPECIES: exodeoxyribonuclease VII small subunit [unclassified Roseitalea]|uniref:exodeoxyribonuclease VII small subunit n=1 Tax=unclassified Roseitalea TaxID=2639107 RepID=UPI00273DFD7D|nr:MULTISPECIES: exodeoxyribonuclease VII small subunit [unclassified Roseitalea]
MADTDPNADVSGLPFEKALDELEKIVDRLERGDVALEESIAIYERGEALRARCDTLLKAAELKIEKIKTGRAGEATGTEPLGD